MSLKEIWNNGYADLNDSIFKNSDNNMRTPNNWNEFYEEILVTARNKKERMHSEVNSGDKLEEIDAILG